MTWAEDGRVIVDVSYLYDLGLKTGGLSLTSVTVIDTVAVALLVPSEP